VDDTDLFGVSAKRVNHTTANSNVGRGGKSKRNGKEGG
jgi:hypothetical protein